MYLTFEICLLTLFIMIIGTLLLSLFFLLIEGSISSLPILLIFFLCITIVRKELWIFPLAFIFGILLDVFQIHPLGETSLFFCIFFFLVLLYKRKYEIDSFPFLLVASFFGSFIYLLIFHYNDIILQSIINSCLSIVIYVFLHIFNKNSKAISQSLIRNS